MREPFIYYQLFTLSSVITTQRRHQQQRQRTKACLCIRRIVCSFIDLASPGRRYSIHRYTLCFIIYSQNRISESPERPGNNRQLDNHSYPHRTQCVNYSLLSRYRRIGLDERELAHILFHLARNSLFIYIIKVAATRSEFFMHLLLIRIVIFSGSNWI